MNQGNPSGGMGIQSALRLEFFIIGLGILRSLDPAVRSDAYRLAVRNFCAAAASLAR